MTTEIIQEPYENDPRSTAQLIEDALHGDDEESSYWEIVFTLQERATRDTFEMARRLCTSVEVKKRTLGARILGQLGVTMEAPVSPFKRKTLAVLLPLLDDPRNAEPKMIGTLISALGHSHDKRIAAPVARFRNHPEIGVRLSVAMSLGGLKCDVVVEALIELSQDEDSDVRHWATFGLGSLIDIDTPEIRTALFNRLADPNPITRNEAIRGLAQRQDKRVIPALIQELTNPDFQGLHIIAFEAAGELADPALLPTLLEYQKANQDLDVENEELNEAIAKCRANLT